MEILQERKLSSRLSKWLDVLTISNYFSKVQELRTWRSSKHLKRLRVWTICLIFRFSLYYFLKVNIPFGIKVIQAEHRVLYCNFGYFVFVRWVSLYLPPFRSLPVFSPEQASTFRIQRALRRQDVFGTSPNRNAESECNNGRARSWLSS